MIIAHEWSPPAIVRSVTDLGLRRVMFGTMIYPNSSSGSSDSIYQAFHREYSGSTTAATNSAPQVQQTCSQILNTETLQGHITSGVTCSCPPGATQPVCVSTSELCSNIVNQIENTPNGQYEQCVCASPVGFPTCTPYYQLCENNLPQYQTQYNTCSCQNPQTTAQPYCISYYQICINNINAALQQNPDQQCYCQDPATVNQQNPICESDYDVCEQNATQYENSNTTCTCSQTSTEPYCCTTHTSQKCQDVAGVAVNSESNIGDVFCASGQPMQDTAQGYTCSTSSAITVCAYGICRDWDCGNGVCAGDGDPFPKSNPGDQWSPYASYWDFGLCGGNRAGYCSSQFSIYEGSSDPSPSDPTINDTQSGPSFILTQSTYNQCSTTTTQSCVQE